MPTALFIPTLRFWNDAVAVSTEYVRNCSYIKKSHFVHSHFNSPASAVLLFGMVALLGASAWVAVTEMVGRANASGAMQPSPALDMAVLAPKKLVSKIANNQLSDAALLVMPESYSGSSAGRIEDTLRDISERAGVPIETREQTKSIYASRLDLTAPRRRAKFFIFSTRSTRQPYSVRLFGIEVIHIIREGQLKVDFVHHRFA
ncbi:hypothetical protein [Paraburkholderia sp. BR14374]|uniref:hypothetical protein n=1 Tax=Paraburkholderia sp. BR14374 TaxID=3237007 RepID=UPI0034CDFE6A